MVLFRRITHIAILCILVLSTLLGSSLKAFAVVTEYEKEVARALVTSVDGGAAEGTYTTVAVDPEAVDAGKILALVSVVYPYRTELYRTENEESFEYNLRQKESMSTEALRSHASDTASRLVNSSMTDLEKIKIFHDYIAANTLYTLEEEFFGNDSSEVVYSAMGSMFYMQGVCDSYTRAFFLLAETQDIPVVYLGSSKINHSWNAVNLDGEWWMLDVTWNDNDETGEITYEYYLSKDKLQNHSFDNGIDEGTIDYADHIEMANWYYFGSTEPILNDLTPELEAISAMTQDMLAEKLLYLGKFNGTGSSFELDRIPTRAEAATMFSRMLGLDGHIAQDSAYFAGLAPFNDMPEWAAPIIGILYEQGLVRGIDENHFGSANATSARDYATMLLRAIGYVDGYDFTWENSLAKAREVGIISPTSDIGASSVFTRGDMVEMTARSLYVQGLQGIGTFGDELVFRNALPENYEEIMGVG